jgi:predicted kinase
MPTLIMCKGLPASGKTTWSKDFVKKRITKTKRVNKDDMRQMIHGGEWSKELEKDIIQARDALTILYLNEGYDVVVDDTNLQPDHEKNLIAIAEKCNADFMVKDFTDVPLNECLRRNLERPNYVPEKAIRRMYSTFIKKKGQVAQYVPPPYSPDLPTCIIVDIDGTLAHGTGRSPYDYSLVHTDTVDEQIKELVLSYFWEGRDTDPRIPATYVIIVSGREDGCKEETVKWLADNHILYDEIYMRKGGDMRDDRIVKREIYDEFIKPRYNVRFVLDDRDRVVKMWRENGLKVLQVAEGDF